MTEADPRTTHRYVGQSVQRREDLRLLTGQGRFVDDVTVPGMLHVAFVRSPVARGTIRELDVSAARSLPGVHTVLTADDVQPYVQEMWATLGGPTSEERPFPPPTPLAVRDVRFVGDPVALVVASSRYVAEDAAELVEVHVEELEPVLDTRAATESTSPLVHAEIGTNVASRVDVPGGSALDDSMARAARVLTRTLHQGRATHVPIEPRGIVANWNAHVREMRIWTSSQNPHEVRAFCGRLLGIPEHHIRVSVGDVGGGFGQKVFVCRDEAAVMVATYLLGRPLKWMQDRSENLIAANQAREESARVTLAVAEDGGLLGAQVDHVEEVGAYPTGGVATVGGLVRMMFPGPYRLEALGFSNVAAYSNTCGRAAYRGPWLMETLAREVMVDHAARELGMDPLELRRRNVIRREDLPYETASGAVYDVVTPAETLEQAAEILDYEGFREEQARARRRGRHLGVGLSLYVEPSGASYGPLSTDQATIRIEPSGQVNVFMGTASSGNSVETTIPQIVADHLGCRIDDVVLRQGDTQVAPFGHGTAGSRSAPVAGAAARQAALSLRDKLAAIAAHLLGVSARQVALADGVATVEGRTDSSVTLAELAHKAYLTPQALPLGVEPGLEAVSRFRPETTYTWSNSCHACTCEIDVATGVVTLRRYVVSEDCGVVINPMVVAGQIAGGVVQGIGGALLEHMNYDDAGNPQASTFLDYLIPTAMEVPTIEYGHIETPSNIPGGYKGMGEGGAIGAPAAVVNAVADALAPFGAVIDRLPVRPVDVLALVDGNESMSSPEL